MDKIVTAPTNAITKGRTQKGARSFESCASDAPSTALRAVPLPRFAGAERFLLRWTCLLVLAVITAPASAQDSVEEFYRGKQVTIVVGSSAGGGYDTYAREIARHIGRYIPGNPTVVPQNMPGAGSNKAAGYIYALAPKDGTTIGAIFPGTILQPLIGTVPTPHDPSKFIYVGSANSDAYMCVARKDAPVQNFKDLLSHELIIAGATEGATTHDLPVVENNLLGTKFKIVSGYPGMRENTIAIERGEVQGVCGYGWTSLETQHPEWLTRRFINIIVQESVRGYSKLNDMGVPRTADFAKTDEDRQIFELLYSQGIFGRPYVLPPGVPADRVAALRKAFMATLRDETLRAEAEKMKLDLDPIAGEDLQALVAKLFALPPPIVARAKQALVYKPPN
jgi:tripartite-type tricarboxylate transporter receptor subunit TctC